MAFSCLRRCERRYQGLEYRPPPAFAGPTRPGTLSCHDKFTPLWVAREAQNGPAPTFAITVTRTPRGPRDWRAFLSTASGGRPPFGWRAEGKELVPDLREQQSSAEGRGAVVIRPGGPHPARA